MDGYQTTGVPKGYLYRSKRLVFCLCYIWHNIGDWSKYKVRRWGKHWYVEFA